MKLYIKNMVCRRCILVVSQQLEAAGLQPVDVRLGEVEIEGELSATALDRLREGLAQNGFELLDDRKSRIVEKVKNTIIGVIHSEEPIELNVNFSVLISQALHLDYNYISTLFSEIEGITIEQYIILQRIERAKELLVYDEYNVSEIAYRLGYSSVQYLSTQFKQVTGLTPTHFKKIKDNKRKPLDEL